MSMPTGTENFQEDPDDGRYNGDPDFPPTDPLAKKHFPDAFSRYMRLPDLERQRETGLLSESYDRTISEELLAIKIFSKYKFKYPNDGATLDQLEGAKQLLERILQEMLGQGLRNAPQFRYFEKRYAWLCTDIMLELGKN
jgi:hypothetical protein